MWGNKKPAEADYGLFLIFPLQGADALASWAWASADWFEWTLSSSIVDQYYFSLRPSLDLKYQRATAPIPTTRIAISMITPFQNQDDMLKNTINWWPAKMTSDH